jgi:chromosome segregation ATPase
LKENNATTKVLQVKRSELDKQLASLQTNYDETQKGLDKEVNKSQQLQQRITQLQSENSDFEEIKEEHLLTLKTIKATLSTKQQQLSLSELSVSQIKQQLEEKVSTISSLQKLRTSGETQLRSLQGELDTLDNKYQKLLRPERSSKGKYVVSIRYKKVGSRKVINFKSSSNASYKQLTQKQLERTLAKLKEKHKADLYLKIIIPEKSGLSYNEVWKFTINLQKKYDYYYQ